MSGSSRPLDFGHWAAHKLEQISNFTLRHGEAVAIGVALDVIYSRRVGLLAAASAERVLGLLETLGYELFITDLVRENGRNELLVLEGLEEFREHLGGTLAITLLKEIGEGFEVPEMDRTLIAEAINELQARDQARRRSGSTSPTTAVA